MTATRIFDVLDALIAAARAAQDTTLAGVLIQDGPPTGFGAPKMLILGGDWLPSGQSRPAVTATREGIGNQSYDETVTVSGAAVAQSGDTDMAARRVEVKAVIAGLEDILAADQTLGGLTYSNTGIATVDPLREVQNERGAACVASFTVIATAMVWNG